MSPTLPLRHALSTCVCLCVACPNDTIDDRGVILNQPQATAIDSHGNYVLVGNTNTRALRNGQTSKRVNALVAKFDRSGGALWTQEFSAFGSDSSTMKIDEALGVSVDVEDNILVAGSVALLTAGVAEEKEYRRVRHQT